MNSAEFTPKLPHVPLCRKRPQAFFDRLILLAVSTAALLVYGVLYVKKRLSPPPEPKEEEDLTETEEPDAAPPPVPQVKYTVVLDAGHSGGQPGCEFDGVAEEDITLAVALLARDKLEEAGVTVVMTREDDGDVSLDRRCQIANDAAADAFVSIHCNSYVQDTSVSGFEGYYHGDERGEALAGYLQNKRYFYAAGKNNFD